MSSGPHLQLPPSSSAHHLHQHHLHPSSSSSKVQMVQGGVGGGPHSPNDSNCSSSSFLAAEGGRLDEIGFLRNSRAIGVLWAVFTSCYAIINVVIFIQPQWLGDTESSRGTGYFGLWKSCRLIQDGIDLVCEGRLDDFATISSPAFRAATLLVGLSVLLILVCLGCFCLFCLMPSSTVFHICGWIQTANGLCLLLGILIFPAGWDSPLIKEVCGLEADNYGPGQCGMRWAMILALISLLDVFVLAILAFVLGSKYSKLIPPTIITSGVSSMAACHHAAPPGGGGGGPSLLLHHHPHHPSQLVKSPCSKQQQFRF